jgi:hypothetical protein
MTRLSACLAYFWTILLAASCAMSMEEPTQKDESSATATKSIVIQGGSADTFQVIVEILPETFRIGQLAEAYFIFRKADQFKTDADTLEFSCSVEQTTGWFSWTFEFLPLDKILKDGYIWKTDFTAINVSAYSRVSPGAADMKIRLRLLKSSQPKPQPPGFGKVESYGPATPETAIEIPPIRVKIFR